MFSAALNKQALKYIGVGIVIGIILTIIGNYAVFVGARIVSGTAFKITGPDIITVGKSATITWDLTLESQSKYPSERIEVCRSTAKTASCEILASRVANDGEATVDVPTDLALGDAYIRLTARDKAGLILSNVYSSRAVKVVAGGTLPSPSPTQSVKPSPSPAVTPSPTPGVSPTPTTTPTTTPSPVSTGSVRGVFSLTKAGGSVKSAVLSNPDVTGISLRLGWDELKPTETGAYQWGHFDTEIARARTAGKKVYLRVNAGGAGGTPLWLMSKNVQVFSFVDNNVNHDTYQQTLKFPVFWDPIFLTEVKKMIAELGARYNKEAAVAYVSSSCANATTADWNMPDSSLDIEQWKSLGYTSEKMLDACKQIVDAYMAAFPDKKITMAVGPSGQLDPEPRNGQSTDTTYMARSIISYAQSKYPGRFFAARNNLSANVPDPTSSSNVGAWSLLVNAKPYTAAQMLWNVSADTNCRMTGGTKPCDPAPTLTKAVTIGDNYGTQFQEIYELDITNTALKDVIHAAAEMLKQ